jgi:hypothetical protein
MTFFPEIDAVDCVSEPLIANVAVSLVDSARMAEDGHLKFLIRAKSVSSSMNGGDRKTSKTEMLLQYAQTKCPTGRQIVQRQG